MGARMEDLEERRAPPPDRQDSALSLHPADVRPAATESSLLAHTTPDWPLMAGDTWQAMELAGRRQVRMRG